MHYACVLSCLENSQKYMYQGIIYIFLSLVFYEPMRVKMDISKTNICHKKIINKNEVNDLNFVNSFN
jgi:hypothetical protein